jgi:hypothetical protein
MAQSGLNQSDLHEIGFASGQVSRVVRSERGPSIDTALLFYVLFGIPIEAWASEEALKRAQELRAQYGETFHVKPAPPPPAPTTKPRSKPKAARAKRSSSPRPGPVKTKRRSPSPPAEARP